MVCGFAALLMFKQGGSPVPFFVALVLVGMGTQAVNVPYGALIVLVAPPDRYGPVTSSRTTVGQMGYAIGLAGATVMIDHLTAMGTIERLRSAGVSPIRTADALPVVTLYVQDGADATTAAARQVLSAAADAYAAAFATTMGWVAVLLAVVGAVSWWLLRPVAASVAPVDGPDPTA